MTTTPPTRIGKTTVAACAGSSPTSTSTPSPVIVNPSSLRYRAITSRGGMSVSDGVLGTRWSGTVWDVAA